MQFTFEIVLPVELDFRVACAAEHSNALTLRYICGSLRLI